jgi:hypothetical protein
MAIDISQGHSGLVCWTNKHLSDGMLVFTHLMKCMALPSRSAASLSITCFTCSTQYPHEQVQVSSCGLL